MALLWSNDVELTVIYTVFILCTWALAMHTANIIWFRPRKINIMLNNQGVRGPPPLFMLGNLLDMKKINEESLQKFQGNVEINSVRHDIWAVLFPQFKQWSRAYGEKFVFWLGTEPFIYVRDPEFIRMMSLSTSLDWGKPAVFRDDKVSLFGNGLIMADGTNWAHRRRIVAQAFHMDKIKVLEMALPKEDHFASSTLKVIEKGMIGDMVELILPMVERWRYTVIAEGESADINIEDDITEVTENIIAKTTFGPNYEEGKQVFSNLRNLKKLLSSKCNHLVGVPGSRYICGVHWSAKKLAKETDRIVESIISSRKRSESTGQFGNDLLGLILSENMRDAEEKKLTTRDLVDDCKAFFIAGHETTTVYVIWSMMLLALNPDWQERVRREVMEITQGRIPDADMLGRMKNMGMVMNESMRLYPATSYTYRQANQNMQMGDIFVPKGTSIWFDILGLHHDPDVWGVDVNDFNPKRFELGASNACKHPMGFLPFGFGNRNCVAQYLANVEIQLIITMVLSLFRISISPTYCHSPKIVPSLKPYKGMPLIFHFL